MFGIRSTKTSGRDNRSTDGGKRTFTMELSLSALITTVVVSIVSLCWVFAFGVIVGRGYSPETQMPDLARLMTSPGQNATESAPEILKAEDLTFMTDLKQKPGVPVQPTRMSNGTAPAASNSTMPATAARTASGNATKPVQTSVTQPEALFDFVLQIVAYKNSSQADTLRERLEGEGMRTRMSVEKAPNGKARWYRVQVILRGTEADMEVAKARLASLGMKDASVASRKPAGRSR